jgi:hypothetical protein
MTFCPACERIDNQAYAAYQANRSRAPRLEPIITISNEVLRSIQQENISETKDLAAKKNRLRKLKRELDAADQGWAFLCIESKRRRDVKKQSTQLDDEIARDEADLLQLRAARKKVDKMILTFGD